MYCRFHIFLWTFSSDCEFRQIITLRKFAIREQILKTEVENSKGTFKTHKSKRNWHCHGKNEKRTKDWATQTPKNGHQQSKYIFYSKSSISGVLQKQHLFIYTITFWASIWWYAHKKKIERLRSCWLYLDSFIISVNLFIIVNVELLS